MERLSDRAIDILNELHIERIAYNSEYLPLMDAANKLAAYEDAEEQGRLIRLPCAVGDKVRDEISDYVFTVQKIETCVVYDKPALVFRCGNEGTNDYMAFFDFEIGEKITVLPREEKSDVT